METLLKKIEFEYRKKIQERILVILLLFSAASISLTVMIFHSCVDSHFSVYLIVAVVTYFIFAYMFNILAKKISENVKISSKKIDKIVKLEFGNQSHFRKAASQIAKYKSLRLSVFEVSPFLRDLMENGLTEFKPILVDFHNEHQVIEGQSICEFSVQIDNFVDVEGFLAKLHFIFQIDKCFMLLECDNQLEASKIILEKAFNDIDVRPFSIGEFKRELSWQEADEIILRVSKR